MCTAVPFSQAESLLLYPILFLSRLEGSTSSVLQPLSLVSSPHFSPQNPLSGICVYSCVLFSCAIAEGFFLNVPRITPKSPIAIYPVLILLDRDRVHGQGDYIP